MGNEEDISDDPLVPSRITTPLAQIDSKIDFFCDDFFSKSGVRVTSTESVAIKEHIANRKIVALDGEIYVYESFVWYAITGVWIEDFIYLDSDVKNSDYMNLVPANYEVEKCEISKNELADLFEYDESDGFVYWFHQKDKSSIWNNLFPCYSANKIVEGRCLVEVDGRFYKAEEVNAILMDLFMQPPITFQDNNRINVRCENLVGFAGVAKQKPSNTLSSDANDVVDSGDNEYGIDDYGVLSPGEKVGRNKSTSCVYCGDTSQKTCNHNIPISYRSTSRNYEYGDTVPCCLECNIILGNRAFITIEERASYLADRLASKYKKVLCSYSYKENELSEFGDRLKSMLEANINQKSYIISRIDHCHKVSGSLYSPEQVSHLTGVTTEAKRSAYKILSEFVHFDGSTADYTRTIAEEYKQEESVIRQLINESIHVDVAIQLKFDQNFPLDASIKNIRKALICRQ